MQLQEHQTMQSQSPLTYLHLSNCGKLAPGSLQNLLIYLCNIEHLSLENCEIANEGVKIIGSQPSLRTKLKRLNLVGNPIRDIKQVSVALGKLRHLERLRIDDDHHFRDLSLNDYFDWHVLG
jgi:hypothetical protein